MIIYIAAPYTNGDTAWNVNIATKYADAIIEKGHTPYIPHLTHFWHLISPKLKEFWLEYDLKFLPKCDCLYRAVGYSKGADAEVRQAKKLGMYIYYNMEDIPNGTM